MSFALTGNFFYFFSWFSDIYSHWYLFIFLLLILCHLLPLVTVSLPSLMAFTQLLRKTFCGCQLCSGVHYHCRTFSNLHQDYGNRWNHSLYSFGAVISISVSSLNYRSLLSFCQARWYHSPTGISFNLFLLILICLHLSLTHWVTDWQSHFWFWFSVTQEIFDLGDI